MRTTTTEGGDFARAVAFERRLHAAAAARVESLSWGTAYLRPELDLVYDENFVWGDGPGMEAATAIRDADRVLGNLAHRRVVVSDEPSWRALTPGFAQAGWTWSDELAMVHRSAPDREEGANRVEEVPLAAIEEAIIAYVASEPWGHQPETRRQLLEHHRGFSAAAPRERCFAVREGGRTVAYCKLWDDGAVAQIEDVVVLGHARGRGLGRAVVTAACQAARSLEPELLFIVADDADWPKHLYARLGFDPVGRWRIFDRRPAA